jgi:hypothetical protein
MLALMRPIIRRPCLFALSLLGVGVGVGVSGRVTGGGTPVDPWRHPACFIKKRAWNLGTPPAAVVFGHFSWRVLLETPLCSMAFPF